MAEVTMKAAREQLSDLLNRAHFGGERTVVTRRGRPFAALVPLADLERLAGVAAEKPAGDR